MRRLESMVIVGSLAAALPAWASEPSIPRGVGPEFARFYQPAGDFTCISHPSITVDRSRINDDYCDCPDGSDEPGTAACSYLSASSHNLPYLSAASMAEIQQGSSDLPPAPALPGFYCANKGHIAAYVPFEYVNDGKCDSRKCCDGSDEWAGIGGTKCEDRCKAMNKEWKKQEELREKGWREALKAREKLVTQAEHKRQSIEDIIARSVSRLEGLRAREVELRIKLEETERRERGKLVKGAGKKGKAGMLAGLAKQRVEELRIALAGVLDERTKMRDRVIELEAILGKFQEEHNPNFNDEGVKRAVKAWQDYAANKAGSSASESMEQEQDLNEIAQPDTETVGINWAEWEGEEEESDVEALYQFEGYLPASLRDWIAEKVVALRSMLVANGILADRAGSTESKAVAEARAAYETVTTDVVNEEQSITTRQADLVADYGSRDIYRALKDVCISLPSGEYDYEMCFLGHTMQKSRKGGSGGTNMGKFVRLGRVTVDEEMLADGKGLGSGERTTMEFEGALHCWNGPDRSTTVVLGCAVQNEIWRVREEEKCKYRMEVGTPAACEGGSVRNKSKDEL